MEGMSTPSIFTANVVARSKRAILNGKEYIVAPATIIVPGVLPGSKGPLYYPEEEVAKSVRRWDNAPLTLYHPYDPLTNEHLSASDPGVLERQGIGFIRGTAYNGKLRTEAWFEAERTKQLDPRVYTSLVKGQPIELSTGLYTDNQPALPGSHFNGRPYTHIARNYRADHLAVLPDQRGACSLSDGCGVLINRELVVNQYVVNEATNWGTSDMVTTNTPSVGGKEVKPTGMKGTILDPKVKGICERAKILSEAALVATRNATDKDTQKAAHVAHKIAKQAHVEAAKAGKKYDYSLEMQHLAKANYHDLKMREFAIKAGMKMSPVSNEGNDIPIRSKAQAEIFIANSLPPTSFFQEGEDWQRVVENNETKYVLTLNPFVSKEQRRACYAQDDPAWDCDKWEKETKRVKATTNAKTKRVKEDKTAAAKLIGTQTSPDGRNIAMVRPTGGAIAGQGDEDSHNPGMVFDPRVKADRKVTGYSVPVQVSNEYTDSNIGKDMTNNEAVCPDCGGMLAGGKCATCGYKESEKENVVDETTENRRVIKKKETVIKEKQPRHPWNSKFQGKVSTAAKKGNKVMSKKMITKNVLDHYKSQLLANCSCESERKAVRKAIMNTADETGDGSDTEQAGGEEETNELEYESDEGAGLEPPAEVGDAKLKAKTTVTTAEGNKKVANSMSELVDNYGTPQEREAWHNAMRINNEARETLIRRLVANVDDGERKKRLIRDFRQESIKKLHDLVAIQGNHGPMIQPTPHYIGAASPALNSYEDSSDDVLELPVMNWKDS